MYGKPRLYPKLKGNASEGLFVSSSTCLSLAGNAARLTWVRHSSRKSSVTHSYQCVYICACPNNGMAASVWDF